MTINILNRHIKDFKSELSKVVKTDAIDGWMLKENPAFDNRTPIQVIKDGDVNLLYNMIYDLGSGNVN